MSDLIPRLCVGAGDGVHTMCAMQAISWEQGDEAASEFPENVDRKLARIVQMVNDSICTHDELRLCAPCSIEVMTLAHRVVDTRIVGWSEDRVAGFHLVLDEIYRDDQWVSAFEAAAAVIELFEAFVPVENRCNRSYEAPTVLLRSTNGDQGPN